MGDPMVVERHRVRLREACNPPVFTQNPSPFTLELQVFVESVTVAGVLVIDPPDGVQVERDEPAVMLLPHLTGFILVEHRDVHPATPAPHDLHSGIPPFAAFRVGPGSSPPANAPDSFIA